MSSANKVSSNFVLITVTVFGVLLGAVGSKVIAQMKGPSEHKGISVTNLGTISEESLTAQLGIKGFVLRMRTATIAPGGHIKEHSHATRPGLVKMVSGTWIEGKPDGEVTWNAGEDVAMLEDKDTVHWVYNRGDTPATAIICGIQPGK
jgi:quercetin dioxygenase-like cupin family protein